MAHGFEVYIDESGCEGFKFRPKPQPGSPEWFVLGAVIFRADQRKPILDYMRNAKDGIAPQRQHIHFIDLSHDQKVAWINSVVGSKAVATTVLIDKPKLQNPDIFRAKDRLYFYGTRLLLERVSWICRDEHARAPAGDGIARIYFSKRKNMSYEDLTHYLDLLRWGTAQDEWLGVLLNDIRIHWPAIKTTEIEVYSHMSLIGLQMADAVCGALRAAVEYTNYNFTEHRFAKMLKPVVYSRGGNFTSYGLKFFPAVPNETVGERPRYHWIQKHYSRV